MLTADQLRILCTELHALNPNVEWYTFMHTTPMPSIERIRRRLWVDTRTIGESTNIKYFRYYTNLLTDEAHRCILSRGMTINILYPNTSTPISAVLQRVLTVKIDVIHRVLDLMGIHYKPYTGDTGILIPIASITYPNINAIISEYKGQIIWDNELYGMGDTVVNTLLLTLLFGAGTYYIYSPT